MSKISFLSVFHPYRGGIAQFNDTLSSQLKKHNELQLLNFKKQYPDLLFPGKSQLLDGHDSIKEGIFNNFNPLTYKKQIAEINKFNPDVFITAYWMPFFAPGLGWITKKLNSGIKKIALLHNIIPHEQKFYDDYLNRFFLNQFDGFITLSETVTKDLLKYKPNAKYCQLFHPNYNQFGSPIPINEAKIKLNIPTDKKVVLFFGFIRKYKGLDILIDAIEKMVDKPHVIIAGESYEDFSIYQKQIDKHNWSNENYTRLDGFISDDKVRLLFSASDVVALPYKSATQSGIGSIAKSFGVPMVVTPVGELPNSIRNDYNGILTDDISADSFSIGLQKCFNKLDYLTTNAKEEISSYSWERFAEKTNEFIAK